MKLWMRTTYIALVVTTDFVITLAMLTSCTAPGLRPSEAGFAVTVLDSTYAPRASVRVILQNYSQAVVYRKLCYVQLERIADGGMWREAGGRVCPEDATPAYKAIAPGGHDQFDFTLPPALAAGRYRIVLHLEQGADGSMLPASARTSTLFVVR